MDEQPSSTVRIINAGKARVNLGQMLDEVYYKGDQIIIERAGRPMAALVPISQLEELRKHSGPVTTEHDTIKANKRRSNKRKA